VRKHPSNTCSLTELRLYVPLDTK